MRGCGCLVMLVMFAATGLVVFLALQPVSEAPPTVSTAAAARFESKFTGGLTRPASELETTISEEEANSKLAATLGELSQNTPLRNVFVRFRPENRVTGVVLAEVFGRPVGGMATFRLASVTPGGSGFAWEDAQIGALPLPVGIVTGVIFPWLEQNGLTPPTPSIVPASIGSMRIEGQNLILTGK